MNILTKIISGALIGIGIGSLITFLITTFIYGTYSATVPSFAEQFPKEAQAVGYQLLIFALLGISQSSASLIFKLVSAKRGFLFITCLHYSLIALPLLAAAWYLRWMTMTYLAFISLLMLVSIFYSLVFFFRYFSVKKDIIQINAKL